MRAEHGLFAGGLKPGPRAKALWRGALDLVFPPQSLDGGEAPMAGGLSAETWSRIHFLDGPVCDGCGVPLRVRSGRPLSRLPGEAQGVRRGPRRLPLRRAVARADPEAQARRPAGPRTAVRPLALPRGASADRGR
ncbi:hypothetical protein [Phenylobacterium sp. J367]|uniref:hypothetical protein n=1 Tax=Phenylobacterium sp. J367 TaxID=2898435 RepID=UPI002150FF1E|nr:hypothetical protein [Phenylobacterium sp. J367]MCR5877114.1 hypothetical protein [Phenylobacterium sp. J367]